MQSSTDVVILYEHIPRELDVVCAVRSMLKRRHGLRAEIVQWPCGIPEALGRLQPALVMLPFCYNWMNFGDLLLDWRHCIFFNLAWEQLLNDAVRSLKMPADDFARHHVFHHSWSESHRQKLLQAGVPDYLILMNGHPGCTLYQHPYKAYFECRDKLAGSYHLDASKRWILFPENYYWGYCEPAVLEKLRSSGTDDKTVKELREYCRSSLQSVIRWLSQLATESPVEVIVRPRPVVRLDYFRDLIRELVTECTSLVKIIKSESVREWILASDVVLSSYSTTLLEAAVADKPSFAVEPTPLPTALQMPWGNLIPSISSYGQLKDACLDKSPRLEINAVKKWVQEALMARGDSITGICRLTVELLNGAIRSPTVAPRWMVTPYGRFPVPRTLLYEYRRIRWRSQRRNPARMQGFLPRYAHDLVSREEIDLRTSRWDALLCGSNTE